jgi:hypothetical protein
MDDSGFEFRQGQEIFLLSIPSTPAPGAHQTSYPKYTVVKAAGAVKLTAEIYLSPRLRLSGAIPPLPLYIFVVWTRATATLVKLNLTNLIRSNSRSIIEELSGKDDLNGSVSGLVRVISAEFVLEGWVKS